jgi:hypothetical protein
VNEYVTAAAGRFDESECLGDIPLEDDAVVLHEISRHKLKIFLGCVFENGADSEFRTRTGQNVPSAARVNAGAFDF